MTLGLILMGVILLGGGLTLLGLWGYPKLRYKIEFHQNWKERAMSECGCRLPGRDSASRFWNGPNHATVICYDCGRYWMAVSGHYGTYWHRAPKWKVFQMRRGWDRDDLRLKTLPEPVRTRELHDAAMEKIDRLPFVERIWEKRRYKRERIGSSRRI